MMSTIETRLKSLRDVAFQEEQDYHQLILAEKDINVRVHIALLNIIVRGDNLDSCSIRPL